MKKILLSITALCLTITVCAQKLIHKIPSDASVVVSINGGNIMDLVSLENFSNSKIGTLLTKELKKDTRGQVTNIKDLGFNFNKDFHYFLSTTNGATTHCVLAPLVHSKGVLSALKDRQKEKIVTKGNISYILEDKEGLVIMWNEELFMVYTSGSPVLEREYYAAKYDYDYDVEEAVVEDAVELTYEEQQEKYRKEDEQREKKRVEKEKKREALLAEVDAKKATFFDASLIKAFATFSATSKSHKSILTNSKYVKSIGKGDAEVTIWADDFAQLYLETLGGYLYSMTGGINPYEMLDIAKLYGNASLVAKLDFDEDKAIIKTVYQMNDEMADIYRPMYDGKFNKNFFKYINQDQLLGYMSLNVSTEGILQAYPSLMDNVFRPSEKEPIAEMVSLGVDLFSTLIDEKGAAEILRGDMVLLVTDLAQREITYTDYEYDAEYNYEKIEKTKTETVPDFLYMFTSEKREIFNKIMRIGVREGEIEVNGGLYKFLDMPKSSPLDLYFMFKDNIVFMGSSKTQMTAMMNGTYVSKLSSNLKKSLGKNASSVFVDGKKIVTQIPVEEYPRNLRDKIGFLTNNIGVITMNSEKLKGNAMKGEMVFDIPNEGHKNSLQYIINVLDSLMD